MSPRVAVVTGSNKGIGLAAVRGLLRRLPEDAAVYLTSRDDARGLAAVQQLRAEGLRPRYHQLDVTDRGSVQRLADHLRREHGGLDILVNNAAVASKDSLYYDYEWSKVVLDIDYYAILTIEDVLFPLVRDDGRIVNVSSDCGHLSNVRNQYWVQRLKRPDLSRHDINEFVQWFLDTHKKGEFKNEELADNGTIAAYRVAKVALSALSMLQQRSLAARGISVNSMHPGLVRTEMTNGAGFLSADEAARTVLLLALDSPLQGAYVWHDGKPLDWADHTADYYFKTAALFE